MNQRVWGDLEIEPDAALAGLDREELDHGLDRSLWIAPCVAGAMAGDVEELLDDPGDPGRPPGDRVGVATNDLGLVGVAVQATRAAVEDLERGQRRAGRR